MIRKRATTARVKTPKRAAAKKPRRAAAKKKIEVECVAMPPTDFDPGASSALPDVSSDEANAKLAVPRKRLIVARVQRAIDRELEKIEQLIDGGDPSLRSEAERTARTLATLARTLKEITRLTARKKTTTAKRRADDDAIPRDLDEFRRELARRLDALVAGEAASDSGNADGA